MTGVVDVGDAIELTFSTATGSTVTATWIDPDENIVIDGTPVMENPVNTGRFPYTFLATTAGVWTALFTASGMAVAIERYYVRASAVTGPPPLAAVGDVRGQFGTLTSAQEGLASWLLRAASSLVRSQFPSIDAQLTAGRLDRDVVALGVANMVLRVMRNPGGLRSETVGPFSRTYDTTFAAGLLVITPGEQAMFTPTPIPAAEPIGVAMMRSGLAPPPGGGRRGWCW